MAGGANIWILNMESPVAIGCPFSSATINPDITWRQDALKLKTKLYDPFPGALSSSKFQVVTTLPISAWEDFV